MPDQPHIRILMGTLNGATHLQEQLASFVSQTHKNWSLLVSDDGSDDETLPILERFARAHPAHEVKVVAGPGQGAARNYLSLLHAPLPAGALVALSDQDDVWLPQKLARGVQALGDVPADQPAAYATSWQLATAELRVYGRSAERAPKASFGNALLQNILPGHSLMLTPAARDLVLRAGLSDTVHHHDWWIYLLVAGAGGQVMFDTEPMVIYRQHSGNLVGSNHGAAATLSRLAKVMSREYGDWVHGNIDALYRIKDQLSPDNRHVIEALVGTRRKFGPGWAWRLYRLGLRRQSKSSTFIVLLAAMLGRI